MKRRFQGLHQADQSAACEVQQFEGKTFTGRVYCTAKALWKLTWFLRDFGYDTDLLGHDEVDDKNLLGLCGVVKINRVRVRQPNRNLQIKVSKHLSATNEFVAYVDAIGHLDGTRCLLEWKTSSARYPEEPDGLLALDPQLVCYSWMTGISEVAQIVFVRKRLVEVQYLRTTITEEQRREFGQLVDDTIRRIQSAQFLPHSGIRFPQNPCSTCPYVGFCLGRQDLAAFRSGAEPWSKRPWLD